MGHLGMHFQPFFDWLVRTTLQASVLICLILLVQRALGHRLGVRGRYVLWLVLLIRMALPWAPHSRVSVYNILPFSALEGHRLLAADESGRPGLGRAAPDGTSATNELGRAGSAADGTRSTESESQEGHWPEARTMVFLSLLWLTGVGSLAGYILAGNVRLWRVVRRAQPVADRQILDLLEECKSRIGTRTTPALVASDRVGGPALFGFLRPRLLLPRNATVELSLDELRHIFLHELAHLKRHDILVGAVASLLHIVHWFNPLIGVGFKRMRADRELACDGLALSVLDPDETCAYGRTVVHQIEQLLASRPRPMLAGLCGERARIKQRIATISLFRKEAYRRSPLAMALVGCLACVALTDGRVVVRPSETPRKVGRAVESYGSPEARAAAHENEHMNVIRVHIRHMKTGKYLIADGDKVTCDAAEPGDEGLWEARFDGSLGHSGTVLFYSVATGRYLTTDAEGNLATHQSDPDAWARWIVLARPQGIWVVSREFKEAYLSLDEQGRAKAVVFNRDAQGSWDIIQLEKVK